LSGIDPGAAFGRCEDPGSLPDKTSNSNWSLASIRVSA
jgi:hypothetical protein